LACGYHNIPVVRDIELTVRSGQVVALLGPNGAGKTTLMRTLAGELPPLGGELLVDGNSAKEAPHVRVRRGMAFVPEGRSLFMQLTTLENLKVAGVDPEWVLEMFPELQSRLKVRAGLMSGGEQQMLTLGRALARRPRLLLADELSLGLAPLVVQRLLNTIRRAADEGVGVVMVEQQIHHALGVADYGCVLRQGSVALEGPARDLRGRLDEIESHYLTDAATGP
jgi:branched-chain amino acid transport system ATP-binding protein